MCVCVCARACVSPRPASSPDRKTSRTALLFLRSFLSTAFLASFLSRGSQRVCVCVSYFFRCLSFVCRFCLQWPDKNCLTLCCVFALVCGRVCIPTTLPDQILSKQHPRATTSSKLPQGCSQNTVPSLWALLYSAHVWDGPEECSRCVGVGVWVSVAHWTDAVTVFAPAFKAIPSAPR